MSIRHRASSTDTLIGVDFGTRRIGLAVGSLHTGRAQPLGSVANKNEEPDWEALGAYVREWQPGRFVVGLPRSMGGEDTVMSERARAFAARLANRFGCPVELVDEQLSSSAAHAQLREARRSGQRRRQVRKADIDPVAAQLILETWLNENRPGQASGPGT